MLKASAFAITGLMMVVASPAFAQTATPGWRVANPEEIKVIEVHPSFKDKRAAADVACKVTGQAFKAWQVQSGTTNVRHVCGTTNFN
ncbi:MAG: hypothetical protein WAY88_03205 [Minisyncoccia bacterium]